MEHGSVWRGLERKIRPRSDSGKLKKHHKTRLLFSHDFLLLSYVNKHHSVEGPRNRVDGKQDDLRRCLSLSHESEEETDLLLLSECLLSVASFISLSVVWL